MSENVGPFRPVYRVQGNGYVPTRVFLGASIAKKKVA